MRIGPAALQLVVLVLPAACGATEAAPDAGRGIAEVDALIVERRYRAALAELDSLLAGAPADAELLDQKVSVLRLLGLERQALALALDRRKDAPEDARLAYEAGELAAHVGDAKLAHEQFAAARALAPDDWRPAVAEAALLLQRTPARLDAADALLQPWLDGPAAVAAARYHHALIVLARGDAAAALVAFDRVLELDARDLPALCNAARLAEAADDRERALRYLRRARSAAVLDDESLTRELDARIAKLAPAPSPHDG